MKKINVFLASGLALLAILFLSAFANRNVTSNDKPWVAESLVKGPEMEVQQSVNLFVTHGHCSSPFAGTVENMEVNTKVRYDAGNPLEDMQMSFEIIPESFASCVNEEQTMLLKTPDVFIDSDHQENIKFKSTNVYTMGIDWYQVNGVLSIKGVESEVKFFVSGIREPNESITSKLILEGKIDLSDWGIDYDKQVYGSSSEHPTKWMHINMKIDLPIDDC
ncbi:MAG: YceI family protein [Crocinitomicaceae bacterium]